MAGNKLGSKERYIYLSDDTTLAYVLRRDIDLAVAGAGATSAAPVLESAFVAPAGVTVGPPPKGFQPRKVNIIDRTDGATKALICFDPTSDLYNSSASQTVTIDGDTFETTGRSGETLTF